VWIAASNRGKNRLQIDKARSDFLGDDSRKLRLPGVPSLIYKSCKRRVPQKKTPVNYSGSSAKEENQSCRNPPKV